MRVAMLIPRRLRSGDSRPPEQVEGEIREELAFHLAEITGELERQGMSSVEVMRVAAERFGDIDMYVQECHRVKTGDRTMVQRILLGSSVVLAALIGMLTWRMFALAREQQVAVELLEQMREQVRMLREEQARSQSSNLSPLTMSDVSGTIHDADGNPIVGAHVLAIYKTWPGGRYSQKATTTRTDDEGTFVLPTQLAISGTHGLQIAFVADGFAFESSYTMNPGVETGRVEPIHRVLEEALPLRARVLGTNGLGTGGAKVFPSGRRTASGDDFNIYFQGAEAIYLESDEKGYVSLPYFAAGDQATIAVQDREGNWKELQADVTDSASPIMLKLPNHKPRQDNPFEF